MIIYIKYTMMINLKKFLKTFSEKYKRIVKANSTRTLESFIYLGLMVFVTQKK